MNELKVLLLGGHLSSPSMLIKAPGSPFLTCSPLSLQREVLCCPQCQCVCSVSISKR